MTKFFKYDYDWLYDLGNKKITFSKINIDYKNINS